MQDQRAANAISSAAVTLFIFLAGSGCMAWLMNRHADSLPLIILTGLAVCVSMILHFVFIGIAARRLGRNPSVWVILSVILFPISSIIGLILFEWFSDEKREPPTAAS